MRLAIILDELGQDVEAALDGCERLGVGAVELRMLGGQNIVRVGDDEVARAVEAVQARGLEVVALATPVLKCALPGLPAAAGALHGARADATIDDSWRDLERAIVLAERHAIDFVRIFSGWRVADPAAALDQVVRRVLQAMELASSSPVEVLLENEHDCNVATAGETLELLALVEGLRMIWDPGNHVRGGGHPAQSGLDGGRERIAHLHLKDVDAKGRWVPLGTGCVPWASVARPLQDLGYPGAWSLETHCEIDGSVEAASRAGVEHLRTVLA